MYVHLDLILTSTQYSTLSNTPLVCPFNPGPFKGTAAQINAACDVWKERCDTFQLSQAVGKALISQVVSTTEPPYLAALRKTPTSHYGDNILNFLQQLFTIYGCITPQQLKACKMKVFNMNYHMALPFDTKLMLYSN